MLVDPKKKEEEFMSILQSQPGIKQLRPDEVSYTVREHPKTIGKYVLGENLGEGSYGKVVEVLDSKTNRLYAMKIIKKRKIKKILGAEESLKRELSILSKIHHPNCIELVEWLANEEKGAWYIVMEYVGGRTLQNLIERAPENRLPLCQARKYFCDLVEAMSYIHKQNIIHRDIKPDNCLLTVDGVLKLCDFGVSCVLDSTEPLKGTGSPAFQAPELSAGSMVSGTKIDIWAAGIVLYIMTIGKFPFEAPNLYALFEVIATGVYSIPDGTDPNLADLLRGMLQVDYQKRITIEEIRVHPFMLDVLKEEPFVPILPSPSMFNDKNTPKEKKKNKKKMCACLTM